MKVHFLHIFFIFCAFVLFNSCELTYDPSFKSDAPSSPAAEYRAVFRNEQTYASPYTLEDLSKELALPTLLDIALYNNPSTRASWSAARAAAFGYHVALSLYYPAITYSADVTHEVVKGGNANSNVATAAAVATTTLATTGTPLASSTGSSKIGNTVATAGAAAAGAVRNNSNATGSATSSSSHVSTLFNQVSGSYLLLDFGGREGQVKTALALLEQANWQHNVTLQQVMLSVINGYTGYLTNKSLAKAAKQNLEDAEVAFKASEMMRKAGLATLTDVLSAQSTVEQMRLNLAQAIGAEKTAFAQFLVTLNLPADTEISVVELPEKLPFIEIEGNISSLIELAKERHPDIGAALAAVKEQQGLLAIAYSSGMPTITLNSSASRLKVLNQSTSAVTDNSISLNLNYPLFQGFFYVNRQRQIEEQIREALATVDVTTSQIISSVVASYYAFTTAEATLPSSRASLEYSARAYKGMLAQYKVGTSSILDVLNSLTTLSNARYQDILARFQWAYSLTNLAFSVGVLEDNSGGWIDDPPSKLYKGIKVSDENNYHREHREGL